ncbi:uncharacterized protein LOC115952435 [Quercus lobata]|uniref:Uncharacterized protein n=1 Tax=Quercus lobata TaxID=97700 RepID=A0A7N2QXU7_QUELO|nr:uncharacterized protein LOC115952435 [Quercus lobata]
MQPNNSSNQGIPFRSILIHSLWLTIVGIVLFLLATANTQALIYVKVFGISGAIIATAPWITQLIVSMAIIILYKVGVCDLTWLVKSEVSGCGSRREVDEDFDQGAALHRFVIARGKVNVRGEYNLRDRFGMFVRVNERNGPQLRRNMTV